MCSQLAAMLQQKQITITRVNMSRQSDNRRQVRSASLQESRLDYDDGIQPSEDQHDSVTQSQSDEDVRLVSSVNLDVFETEETQDTAYVDDDIINEDSNGEESDDEESAEYLKLQLAELDKTLEPSVHYDPERRKTTITNFTSCCHQLGGYCRHDVAGFVMSFLGASGDFDLLRNLVLDGHHTAESIKATLLSFFCAFRMCGLCGSGMARLTEPHVRVHRVKCQNCPMIRTIMY